MKAVIGGRVTARMGIESNPQTRENGGAPWTAANDEWFRQPGWDGSAREDFEQRLARSRPHNQQQYMRIKALALEEAGETRGSQELLQRIIDFPDGYSHEAAFALERLGDIASRQGDRNRAKDYYHRVLNDHPRSAATGSVEISLAEVLLDEGSAGCAEALELLNLWIARPGLKFDSQLFRWHLALIEIAEHSGDRETARRAAGTALELAARGPQLPRHKDVGLVHTDKRTLRRLRNLAK